MTPTRRTPFTTRPLLRALALATALGLAGPALAAPVKVGLALDISGPFATVGAEARDGFALGIKQLGGKLGGQDVEFIQADMAGSPDQARQLVDRMVQRDQFDGHRLAAQAYDVILAMDAAVKQAGGNAQDREAVIAALKKANYASTRGSFKYADNHFPIENFYLRMIGKDAQGKTTNKTISTVLTSYGDTCAASCKMQ